MAPSIPRSYLTEIDTGISGKVAINTARHIGKTDINEMYSYRDYIIEATRVIGQGSDGELTVLKDRSAGFIGKLSNTEAIEVLSAMVVDHIFKDNMKLFSDTKKEEICNAVVKTIKQELSK